MNEKVVDELFKEIKGLIERSLCPLLKRLEDVERKRLSNLADSYRGTFQPNTDYKRGQVLTDKGGLWLCMAPTSKRPGSTDSWKLILKGAK